MLSLSHDEVEVLSLEICDPLHPELVRFLSSTAHGLHTAMQEIWPRLQQLRNEASALASLVGMSCTQLGDAESLRFGRSLRRPLTLAHWRTLGNLVRCGSLPNLVELHVRGCDCGDEGVRLLAEGLRRGSLPSLKYLGFFDVGMGPQGASKLCGALTGRSAPSLLGLSLTRNPLGDAGVAAVALCLRQLPSLQALYLSETGIAARSKPALFAAARARPPTALVAYPLTHWPWATLRPREGPLSPRTYRREAALYESMACALVPAHRRRISMKSWRNYKVCGPPFGPQASATRAWPCCWPSTATTGPLLGCSRS